VEGAAVQQHSETIEISGHLMDSGVLARILKEHCRAPVADDRA